MNFRKHISCVHVCACTLCMSLCLSRGPKNNTAPVLTRSQPLEKGKQILIPHLKPECILKGRPGEHKQKKIIHSKLLEEFNIPHQTTAKYCPMYTIKIITCFYR